MGLSAGVEHHVSSGPRYTNELQWLHNFLPYNPLSMVLSEDSLAVQKSDGFFIRQKDGTFHQLNKIVGQWSIALMLRNNKNYFELFNAYYTKKKVITLECKQVFERGDISEIKAFLARVGVKISEEKKVLSDDTAEKIRQLTSDVLSGKR